MDKGFDDHTLFNKLHLRFSDLYFFIKTYQKEVKEMDYENEIEKLLETKRKLRFKNEMSFG